MSHTIISGATGGLGKAMSYECAKKGYNLILTGRSADKLAELKEELSLVYSEIEILTFPCDLTSAKSRSALYGAILASNAKIDRLINVAGVDTQMAFEKYTEEKLVFQSRVNFEGTVSLTLFALKNRAEKLEILTVSSICAAVPIGYFAVYSSTKAALKQFFDGIRLEYKHKGVQITTVLPGSIPTRDDIILDIEKQGLQGKLSKKSPEYVAQKSLKALSRKKKNYVPGLYNKIVYMFSKIAPRSLASKITTRKFSIKEKDAF